MTRVLIVRLGSLGDIVHAVPAAAAIRRAYPSASIDWIVDARHRDLLDLVEPVDGRLALERGVGGAVAASRQMRARRYDAALDLQGLVKSAVLARLSGARRVIGFPTPLLRERAARICYTETAGEAAGHVIDKNLSMLSAVGVRMADREFPLADRNPSIRHEIRRRLDLAEDGRFAVLNPGAAWPNKRWPPVYFAEVARGLSSRHHLRSVVLWGPGEEALAQAVVDASAGTAVASPATSVADLVSLLKAAALVISGDTGPMHIAGAVGAPVIGLFGPTDPDRNGPWSEDDLVASRYDACACHYQRRCRISAWCLVDITPREVLALAETRLQRHARG